MKDFAGKLAVITGGGAGMGRELARQLVAEGASVALCDVSKAAAAETKAVIEADKPRQGVRISTDARCTAKMLAHNRTSVGPFTTGVRRPHLAVRSHWLSRHLSRPRVAMPSVKSCNQGIWRSDLVAVNGFNERINGWGPEDKECVARLMHAGVQGLQLRFAALATHLHHTTRDPGGRNPWLQRPPNLPTFAGRGHRRHGRAPVSAACPGPQIRSRALGLQGLFRHGRRGGAHR